MESFLEYSAQSFPTLQTLINLILTYFYNQKIKPSINQLHGIFEGQEQRAGPKNLPLPLLCGVWLLVWMCCVKIDVMNSARSRFGSELRLSMQTEIFRLSYLSSRNIIRMLTIRRLLQRNHVGTLAPIFLSSLVGI